MKDFSGYSDDDLLNELDHLNLEISCELGTERGTTLEKLFWLVTKELERRGIDPITGEEIIVGTDVLDDDYEEDVEVEEKGNFGFGREEGRFDEYDLPI
tara:strand:- start:593 stop:889 length:297 start_codon:yes stop_codon:yes gene_type:complete